MKELDDKAEKLEHKRTVTSISLAEERQILKEINAVKKTKIKVEEFNKEEHEVQSMKVRRILEFFVRFVSSSAVVWLSTCFEIAKWNETLF